VKEDPANVNKYGGSKLEEKFYTLTKV